ncbi:MAG TPA: alpha-galactosidase [Chthonomonadales bacterium]|nr:alpha-galactosidase [Chthonomonadales bacterium]
MPKIAMIGAGSIVFCKTLLNDMLATPALEGATYALMSPTETKLRRMEAFARRMVAENGLSASVYATTDRRDAIRDADYVVCMVQVGGVEAFRHDYMIPLKYGVDQCIGDSLGPGGVMRGLRSIPALAEIVRDMEEIAAPGALLLNYTNPMAACCLALGRISSVPFIGLCHGVQTTLDLISGYVGVPKEEIDHLVAGINHMAWFLRIEHRGSDLYPLFRERCERPEYYVNEKVRIEVMRHFGYFMTESTGHLSEYVPWFRSSERALNAYCDQPAFGGESGAYYRWCETVAKAYESVDPLQFESPRLEPRSAEYCTYILEARQTGVPFKLQGNVRNDGYIGNLPPGCCVEVPVYVDRQGLHPLRVGDLPPQCAALNQSNVTVQTLAVDAGLAGDPELVMHAIALDPLTSTRCTLAEVREMTAELLAAEASWLPQFAGKTLKDTPFISVPEGVQPVEVPLDPALAIGKRFGTLVEQVK